MRRWLTVAAAIAVTTGCGSDDADGTGRDAGVYAAAIRDVLAEQPPPPRPDELPVVYVVSGTDADIGADVQAEVAEALDEEAEVRFADRRSEALLDEDAGLPVKDAGVLLVLGHLGADDDQVDLAVEVYRSEDDRSSRLMTIESGSAQWRVTSAAVVDDGAAGG